MTRATRHRSPPEECPVCGEIVPPKALACPGCGADHESGWNEDASAYDGVDLPDDAFNYDDYVKKEFGGDPRRTARRVAGWVIALAVILALLACGALLAW